MSNLKPAAKTSFKDNDELEFYLDGIGTIAASKAFVNWTTNEVIEND